jgi:hypothetical protein
MAEIAGLAIGIASLAGLFTTCIEFLDKVDRAKGFGESYQTKTLQFKAYKHLFQEWGKRAGLVELNAGGTADALGRLNDAGKRSLVYDILASIEQLFVDTEKLEKKYGVTLPHREIPSSTSAASSSLQQARKAMKKANPISRKLVWVVRDEKRFQDLVSLLAGFTDRLYELIPVDDGTAELNENLKSLRLEVDVETKRRSKEMADQIRHQNVVEKYIEDQQRRDTLNWLDPVLSDAEYDIYIHERVETTCAWILEREEYREWKSPNYAADSPEVLWIYGKAGMGKTFLSAKIVEDLKQTSSLPVAFFFATHEDSRKREPLSILRSWIFQLASTRVCSFDEVRMVQTRTTNRGNATDTELWSIFRSCLQRIGRCFLLVDGYDETSNEIIPRRSRMQGARETLLKELFKSVIGTKAHIIIMSRDEVDIRRRISEAQQNASAVIRSLHSSRRYRRRHRGFLPSSCRGPTGRI